MDRLTAKGGRIKFYESVYCKHSNADVPEIRKQISDGVLVHKIEGYQGRSLYAEDLEKIYNKLAAYEDSNLEPAEVEALKAEVDGLKYDSGYYATAFIEKDKQIAVLELALKNAYMYDMDCPYSEMNDGIACNDCFNAHNENCINRCVEWAIKQATAEIAAEGVEADVKTDT